MDLEMSEPETRSWSELPQDILALFLAKLHLADQIRFRAVCKHWRISNDLVKCPDHLPWGVRLDKYPSELELFDPHSNNSYIVTNSTEKFERCGVTPDDEIVLYASKGGWMLLGQGNWSLFRHNAFTNEMIPLPFSPPNPRNKIKYSFLAATFTADPESHAAECEIIVFSRSYHPSSTGMATGMAHKIYIHRYCLSTDRALRPQFLENVPNSAKHGSAHYMNGQVYCVVTTYFAVDPTLICYNLADGRRKALKVKPSPQIRYPDFEGYQTRCWLTYKNGSLVLLLSNSLGRLELALLSYDCSTKSCWTEADIDDTEFYVSGESILSTQPAANGLGCSVNFIGRERQNYCHSVWFQKTKVVQTVCYGVRKVCFIDPPDFKSLVTNKFSC